MRWTGLAGLLTVLLLLMLAPSCGGGGRQTSALLPTASAQLAPAAGRQLPALPPALIYDPGRVAAAFETSRTGAQSFQHSAGVTLGSSKASFTPLADKLEWSIYRFDSAPDDVPAQLDFAVSGVGVGAQVWLAISDYQHQRWLYLDPQTASGSLPLSLAAGQATSPTNQIYVAALAYDTGGYSLDSVSLVFSNRHSVSGQVLDEFGDPLAGVLITTTLDDNGVQTDASGNFTLPTLPDGNWQIMATSNGYAFFDNPQTISVSAADVSGVQFTGKNNRSHLVTFQGPEPNNNPLQATDADPALDVHDSISVLDDEVDCWRYTFNMPGAYYVKVKSQLGLLFPEISVLYDEAGNGEQSYFGNFGTTYVPFVITQAPATRTVLVGCSGGGGAYTLSIGSGPLSKLEGVVSDDFLAPAYYIGFNRILVDDGVDTTSIFTQRGGETFGGWFLQQVYSVTPADPDYDFNPSETSANLGAGDMRHVDFAATPKGFTDFGEPNNTPALATAVNLPVNEAVGNLSLGENDLVDFYKCVPAAGKFLRARIDLPPNSSALRDDSLHVEILDSQEGFCSVPLTTLGGSEARTYVLTDGNPFYIKVETGESRGFSYGLTIEEYDGHRLTIHANTDGQPLEGVPFDIYGLGSQWFRLNDIFTEGDGIAVLNCGLRVGEHIGVHAQRYGMDFDDTSKQFTVGSSDVDISFDADSAKSADSHEPNYSTNPLALSLPASFSATISGLSDHADYYSLNVADATPVRIDWDSGLQPVTLRLEYVDSLDNTTAEVQGSSGSVVLVPDPAGGTLIVSTRSGEGTYSLDINTVDAHVVTGHVNDDALNSLEGVGLYVPETDSYAFTDASGNYILGPLEDGNYTLLCYAPNFQVSPQASLDITVDGMNLTENFSLTYSNNDSGEPAVDDDDAGSARLITDAVPISANLDIYNTHDPTDDQDWYKFTVAGPGLLHIDAAFLQPWYGRQAYVALFDGVGIDVAYAEMNPDGHVPLDVWLPKADTYYFVVSNEGGDYTVIANY